MSIFWWSLGASLGAIVIWEVVVRKLCSELIGPAIRRWRWHGPKLDGKWDLYDKDPAIVDAASVRMIIEQAGNRISMTGDRYRHVKENKTAHHEYEYEGYLTEGGSMRLLWESTDPTRIGVRNGVMVFRQKNKELFEGKTMFLNDTGVIETRPKWLKKSE